MKTLIIQAVAILVILELVSFFEDEKIRLYYNGNQKNLSRKSSKSLSWTTYAKNATHCVEVPTLMLLHQQRNLGKDFCNGRICPTTFDVYSLTGNTNTYVKNVCKRIA